MRHLGENPIYAESVREIFNIGKVPRPREGVKTDPAHPAIHPSGKKPEGRQTKEESLIYDLIVRRFLAAFAKPSVKAMFTITIRC